MRSGFHDEPMHLHQNKAQEWELQDVQGVHVRHLTPVL